MKPGRTDIKLLAIEHIFSKCFKNGTVFSFLPFARPLNIQKGWNLIIISVIKNNNNCGKTMNSMRPTMPLEKCVQMI